MRFSLDALEHVRAAMARRQQPPDGPIAHLILGCDDKGEIVQGAVPVTGDLIGKVTVQRTVVRNLCRMLVPRALVIITAGHFLNPETAAEEQGALAWWHTHGGIEDWPGSRLCVFVSCQTPAFHRAWRVSVNEDYSIVDNGRSEVTAEMVVGDLIGQDLAGFGSES